MRERWVRLLGATQEAALRGPGRCGVELREAVAAFRAPPELSGLVERIRRHAYRVTDAEIDALRAKYDEDQLFEIIVAAAIGAADERLRAGLAALEEATEQVA